MRKLIVLALVAVTAFGSTAALASAKGLKLGEGSASKVNETLKEEETITIAGETGTLEVAGTAVTCKKSKGSIEQNTPLTVQKGSVTFEECKVAAGTCEATVANITTEKLKGESGEVAKAEAADESGLLLEPETGTSFATIPATTCNVETKVTGKVAGELTAPSAGKGKLTFALESGKQKIKTINTEKGAIKPSLKAFGLEATQKQVNNVSLPKTLFLLTVGV
jgi:hypothetical protein